MGLKPARKLHFPLVHSLFVERGFLYAHYRVGQFRGLFRFGGSRSGYGERLPADTRVRYGRFHLFHVGRRFGRYAGECGTVRLFRCSELVVGGLRPDPSGMSGEPCGGTQERGGDFGASCLYAVPAKAYGLVFHLFHVSGHLFAVTNGFASPFIFSFGGIPEYADTFGVQHANILISISQISETFCILLIPFFLGRFGIKRVMLIAMLAWVFRFGFFALGNPGSGVWLFVLSMLVYGVAFDFFNVSGSLFVDKETDISIRSSAQGLFMMMTNGLGATIGTLSAQAVINRFVYALPETASGQEVIAGWNTCWYIFAAYALVVAALFAIFFKYKHVVKDECGR